MLGLRHILHPLRSVKSAYSRANRSLYGLLARRQARGIRRGRRDRCWCGGELLPFKWHPSYGVCACCESYVNRIPPSAEALAQLYSLNSYWVVRQKAHGFPPIATRAELYLADGRVEFWLKLVERYAPDKSRALEVGCAPGVLLAILRDRGLTCLGVEPSEETAAWVRDRYGVDVRTGLFPEMDLPACDLFLAFDVLEHSSDPLRFMKGASDLLSPGGIAIIQTAIDRYDYVPPFGDRFDGFDDVEHLFLFTDRAMSELAARSHLDVVSLGERLWLLGEVAIFRKPVMTAPGNSQSAQVTT